MSNRAQIENLNNAISLLTKVRDDLLAQEAPKKPVDIPPNEALHRAGYGNQHVEPETTKENTKEQE